MKDEKKEFFVKFLDIMAVFTRTILARKSQESPEIE